MQIKIRFFFSQKEREGERENRAFLGLGCGVVSGVGANICPIYRTPNRRSGSLKILQFERHKTQLCVTVGGEQFRYMSGLAQYRGAVRYYIGRRSSEMGPMARRFSDGDLICKFLNKFTRFEFIYTVAHIYL